MALLNTTQRDYYQSNNYGNYQFVSLEDIINQFMVVYVGEEKIISKARKIDIAFHAKRALSELSFDTIKSFKSQEIELPPSLTMIIPHDYVNYTKISSVDNSGIKQRLYPTLGKTSNPFKIKQDESGNYDFAGSAGSLPDFNNGDFSSDFDSTENWSFTPAVINNKTLGLDLDSDGDDDTTDDVFSPVGGLLKAKIHPSRFPANAAGAVYGRAYSCWQEVDVSNIDLLDLSGDGTVPANVASVSSNCIVRLGISSTAGDQVTNTLKTVGASLNRQTVGVASKGPNFIPHADGTNSLAYVEWDGSTGAQTGVTQTLNAVDVSNYQVVYILVTMFNDFDATIANLHDGTNIKSVELFLDNVTVDFEGVTPTLIRDGDSTTWTNYKSNKPNENKQHDYDYHDQIFEANVGRRYGIDPQHAQDNGSYYIDDLKGLIHFSSNLSGSTIVLDYISDSLGTDSEMQVHKFAEEAMYKHIMYAVLSTRSNTPEYIVRRYKKEKSAATRLAKLRLSNIKLEEITQTLRGKSKQIKH